MMKHQTLASHYFASRRGWRARLLLAACLTLPSFSEAGGNPTLELRSLAASCAACHGTNGHSSGAPPLPSLAQLPAAYFIARMREFREDPNLANSVMAQIAKGYDDHQVQQLADYYARQPRARY